MKIFANADQSLTVLDYQIGPKLFSFRVPPETARDFLTDLRDGIDIRMWELEESEGS